MIFGCFQVVGRKCLLPECFSAGDESTQGFLAMVIWPRKEQSYFLGKALGVLRHHWHWWGKGGGGRAGLGAPVVISSLPLDFISGIVFWEHWEFPTRLPAFSRGT